MNPAAVADDDEAEAARHTEGGDNRGDRRGKRERGQNKARKFHFAKDELKLCNSLILIPRESLFVETVCEFAANAGARRSDNPARGGRGGRGRGRGRGGWKGDRNAERENEVKEEVKEVVKEESAEVEVKQEGPKLCAFSHTLRDYLAEKREDIDSVCPVWEARGWCASGWRCRWLKSHSREENGELILIIDEEKKKAYDNAAAATRKNKIENSKVIPGLGAGDNKPQEWESEVPVGGFDDPYGEVLNNIPMSVKITLRKNQFPLTKSTIYQKYLDEVKEELDANGEREENRATYAEEPIRPEEKRRIYIGKDTPLLAPLTTTGNLPFRRLCSSLGAALTYSEMAMSLPLLQGHKPEWALLKAHGSELPTFGAQICAPKIPTAIRATEVLTALFPSSASRRHGLSLIDLNCGCPIDLVYKQGGGSALLEQQSRLLKMLSGMNYVSGETPITIKIRMGCKDAHPTAKKLVQKVFDRGCVQAITLHGRSRQQRYTRAADWGFIGETAALINSLKAKAAAQTDTADQKERRDKPDVYFVANGDVYSHHDYYTGIENSGADSVMVARGALIKPWIFEEIATGQYLDKTATERLEYVKEYCRYGLECWGGDELGVATTRRFLLEWLSFGCRYVPLGILERLPPRIQDRPPAWKGRNEMETLLGSADYTDWIKISEMFLGKCPEGFHFTPKHKVGLVLLLFYFNTTMLTERGG